LLWKCNITVIKSTENTPRSKKKKLLYTHVLLYFRPPLMIFMILKLPSCGAQLLSQAAISHHIHVTFDMYV